MGSGEEPTDLEVDAQARFSGTVSFYNKWRGYGFLVMSEKGVVPEDRVFVYWSSLQSVDRFPFLAKGMTVEFNIVSWRSSPSSAITARANAVTLPGGANIALQDDVDRRKEFVGSQELRYTGVLKFYDAKRGFGYVKLDPNDHLSDVPSELRVERAEVNVAGNEAFLLKDTPVEFGIWKTKTRGAFKVYNMTLSGSPGMTQVTRDDRDRADLDGICFRGQVSICNWDRGWGFLKLDDGQEISADIQAKLSKQTEEARQKAADRGKDYSNDDLIYFRISNCKPGATGIQRGSRVTFSLYTDDKGVGAANLDLAAVPG